MKVFSWILIAFGIVNLFIGKIPQALIVGGVGIFLLALRSRYEIKEITKEKPNISSPPIVKSKNENFNKEVHHTFKMVKNHVLDSLIIERQIGESFSNISDVDKEETIESFRRWAKNQKCDLSEVKSSFLNSFEKEFGDEDIDLLIGRLGHEAFKEAEVYQIHPQNTCCHYMVKWIIENKIKRNNNCTPLSIEAPQEPLNKSELPKPQKMGKKLLVRNRKKLSEVFKDNPDSHLEIRTDGNKPFFLLGNEVGYVTPEALGKIREINQSDNHIVDLSGLFEYAEFKKEGYPDFNLDNGLSNWIPKLSLRSVTNVSKYEIKDILIVEEQTGKDFTTLPKEDIVEIMDTFFRLTKELKCELVDVKYTFLYPWETEYFSEEELLDRIRTLTKEAATESFIMDIKASNSSSGYKLRWLMEYKQKKENSLP